MITSAELSKVIREEIDKLPGFFPYSISVAKADDDANVLALVQEHCESLATACSWEGILQRGEQGIAELRQGRITVLARDGNGLRGMITYVPADDKLCWLQAIATEEKIPLDTQLQAVGAMSIPVHRALLTLSCEKLVTRTFPVDSRMASFAGMLRDKVPLTVAEHRLDATGKVTHWSFSVDIAESLALFERMGLG